MTAWGEDRSPTVAVHCAAFQGRSDRRPVGSGIGETDRVARAKDRPIDEGEAPTLFGIQHALLVLDGRQRGPATAGHEASGLVIEHLGFARDQLTALGERVDGAFDLLGRGEPETLLDADPA